MDLGNEAQGPRSVSSRIVSSEVLTLELENVSNQQLAVHPRHLDKPGMKTVGVGWVGEGVDPQHFDRRCKTHLFSKQQSTGKDGVWLERLVDNEADATSTQVDRFLDEDTFRHVRLSLKTDREGDSDTIVFSALRIQWRRSGRIR